MRLISSFFFFLVIQSISAQVDIENYQDYVFEDYIKSVEFGLNQATLSQPIINLNSRASLVLEFDDISGDDRDFIYDIVHCDRNWNPSDLDNMQYLEGFTREELDNVEFSISTDVNYAHYTLTIPNEDIKWILSGNYTLIVMDEGNDDQVVLTRRFMVVDNKVGVQVLYERPSIVSKFDTHQEFDFEVNFKNITLEDPQTNITAVVMQNNRWDNALFGLKPKFITRDNMVFNYSDVICFPALKEYRSFDTRSINSTGMGVFEIELTEESNEVVLNLQENLAYVRYLQTNDANGEFVLYTEDNRNARLGADYTNVHFTLKSPKLDHPVFVVGKFNDYQPMDECMMDYSESRNAYFTTIQLKQGFYDYMFAQYIDDQMNLESLQGSWYEAENDYSILIYYSTRYEGYDQLIGIKSFNSNNF